MKHEVTCRCERCLPTAEWFEEGAALGFEPEELEMLVPPPGAAELIKKWLKEA
jgi:hypothetical protein